MRGSDRRRGTKARAALLGAALVAFACAASCSPREAAPAAAKEARRIAVLSPAGAETLAALGVADRIVAVGDFIDFPRETLNLPRLGAYNLPNAERLIELRVDLLLTAASEAARGEHERLVSLGVDVLALDTSTFAGALAAITETGKRVGRAGEARALVESIERRVSAVKARVASAERPRVLIAVGEDPVYVAGPGSHLDELIEIAGGENLAFDALGAYATIAVEAVLERKPDLILDSADNRLQGPYGALAGSWGRWPFLPAVANGRVFHLEPSRLLIPGPRLGEMAERMGRFVHPEIFGPPHPTDFASRPEAPGAQTP